MHNRLSRWLITLLLLHGLMVPVLRTAEAPPPGMAPIPDPAAPVVTPPPVPDPAAPPAPIPVPDPAAPPVAPAPAPAAPPVVPVPIPVPDPAAPPVAPAPDPAAPALAPAVAAVTPVPAPAANPEPKKIDPSIYKQEVDTINTQIQAILAAKEAIKKLLSSVDGSIDAGKKLIIDARKKSLDILKKTEPEALTAQNDINTALSTINDAAKMINDTVAVQFKAEVDKVQAAMKTINATLDQLKAKGLVIKSSQAQADITAAPAPRKHHFGSWIFEDKQAAKTHANEEPPTFIHYALNKVANAITTTIRVAYITVVSIKDALFGLFGHKTPAQVHQIPAGASAPAPAPGASAPAPTQVASLAAGLAPAAGKPVALIIQASDTTLMGLVQQREILVTQARMVEDALQALSQTIDSNPDIAHAVMGDDTLKETVRAVPAWQRTILNVCASSLEYLQAAYETVTEAISHAYYAYLAPFFTTVKVDVQKKIKQQEQAAQPASTQPAPLIPVPTIPAT